MPVTVGGSIGSPVVSNKTFFFGDYEYFRNTHGLVNNLTLPTAKMRASMTASSASCARAGGITIGNALSAIARVMLRQHG